MAFSNQLSLLAVATAEKLALARLRLLPHDPTGKEEVALKIVRSVLTLQKERMFLIGGKGAVGKRRVAWLRQVVTVRPTIAHRIRFREDAVPPPTHRPLGDIRFQEVNAINHVIRNFVETMLQGGFKHADRTIHEGCLKITIQVELVTIPPTDDHRDTLMRELIDVLREHGIDPGDRILITFIGSTEPNPMNVH